MFGEAMEIVKQTDPNMARLVRSMQRRLHDFRAHEYTRHSDGCRIVSMSLQFEAVQEQVTQNAQVATASAPNATDALDASATAPENKTEVR